MFLSRCSPRLRWPLLAAVLTTTSLAAAAEPGLLFYLSGDKGTTAEVAAPGTAEPTFVAEVKSIPGGAKGGALECGDYQRLAYRSPGNIYAQRGTLSFFWRSRYPVGPTEFPVFRVGYADHSSWDMVWLRIDYNGHGFDAFVTDANLSRVRVSVPVTPFPSPGTWTHLAISWDENRGIRFYVNGKLAAENKTVAVLNTALDQFGPHSRIISPYQVQSDYNFTRGGDIDEVRIYDRMLDDAGVAVLAKGDAPALAALPARSLTDVATRAEWDQRYGFGREIPPGLPAGPVTVRKVEITDAYDLKRWWWKATDGIPETTWPGVYNRSRLPGRHDYFTLPDWDCYVDSGKAVTFVLPNEPVNRVVISGAAWGRMELLPKGTNIETASEAKAESLLFQRPQGREKTVDALDGDLAGRQIRFTNVEQEQPISELSAYNVTAGAEPAGSTKLAYRLTARAEIDAPSLAPLQDFIAGRFPADERTTLIALPAATTPPAPVAAGKSAALPLTHVLIPDGWDQLTDGLDGIAIDMPAFTGPKPEHDDDRVALNIQVKDPLWPMRNMLDFTYSIRADEKKTLWLDLRDRLLPPGKALYLTVACTEPGFTLEGATLRLVFKPRAAARAEHELDRFTQARDSYAMLVEEHPSSPKLNLWVRFKGDLEDLLRVNPDHELGRQYAAAAGLPAKRPEFTQPAAPAGVPLWAFRQTYLLGQVQRFVDFYIDHRQSAYGDFGGGISDDVDLLNTWPGVSLMGAEPEKINRSLHRLLEAAFTNGMFTNGLPTIQADELHSYEEGINCLAQNLIADYGSPRQLERAMATARGIEGLTGVNAAGHRHIRTSYYSGSRMSEDGPWGWSKPYSYLVCQVPQLLVDYNGNPAAKKIQLELADGLMAHRRLNAGTRNAFPTSIHFSDDAEGDYGRGFFPWHMFWAAWEWTGDRKYLTPILDSNSGLTVNANALDLLGLRADWAAQNSPADVGGRLNPNAKGALRPGNRAASLRGASGEHFAWQVDGDKSHLERLYAAQIENCAINEFIETEGSLWIDRVGAPTGELQRARLGGVALLRGSLYPGHAVSWKFAAPATGEDVAILVPDATRTRFKVIAYNLSAAPVTAEMTGWNIDPGQWEITQGVDTDGDDVADQSLATRTAPFERSRAVTLTLPSRATTVLTFKLKTPGTPYWSRPDLGLDPEDVTVQGREVHVTVHSLGSVAAPATTVLLRDAAGRVLATEKLAGLAAPLDLQPKTAGVTLTLPAGTAPHGCTVEIDPEHQLEEITARNNAVKL